MTVQGISKIEGGCAAIYCWSFSWVLRMFWLVKHIESFSKPIPCIAADEYFSRDETWYCRLESTASPAASWPFSGSDLWISALPERTGVSGNTWNRCLLRILIAGVWPDKQRSLFTTQSIRTDNRFKQKWVRRTINGIPEPNSELCMRWISTKTRPSQITGISFTGSTINTFLPLNKSLSTAIIDSSSQTITHFIFANLVIEMHRILARRFGQ